MEDKKDNLTKYDLHKVGGILLKERKLLICRTKGKKSFIAPGGKLKKGEGVIQALQRELKEELSISVLDSDISEFGVFYAPAAEDEKNILRMDVFLVKRWEGALKPSSEIDEIAWISTNFPETMSIGSIFEHQVIPRLKQRGMID
ncbi:MAG: hypothetical protein A3C06_03020 [Candidatus Taylorbacteria bacterium RIFCSPHIGHO2_02_FULL_46_13]|uniref:8-oxo-dGTP diphosphatase n=1 Tax=Candidatus Taylorbacteria bacterium RIFCSPHIGHO2_02_FULL_46_13 TaxID=1802312 RepID=A0A1G2MRP0_9BACT|nr:MAG: hypothetical protein A3C06_03020 [Candidatus Taylorbacteria bacterium RIFCSPHIGHO2_02_FULL_46_13]